MYIGRNDEDQISGDLPNISVSGWEFSNIFLIWIFRTNDWEKLFQTSPCDFQFMKSWMNAATAHHDVNDCDQHDDDDEW